MGSPPVIWLVDDDRSFRDMSDAIAIEAEVALMTMGVEELAIRRNTMISPTASCSTGRCSQRPMQR
jgi:hypothetical protein